MKKIIITFAVAVTLGFISLCGQGCDDREVPAKKSVADSTSQADCVIMQTNMDTVWRYHSPSSSVQDIQITNVTYNRKRITLIADGQKWKVLSIDSTSKQPKFEKQ